MNNVWHNSYRHWKIESMNQIQILAEAFCISLCANALEKDMGPFLLIRYQKIVNFGSAHGVMVIVVGNGHSNTSSNPGQD